MVSSLPATSNLQDSKARHSTGTTTAEHVEVLLAVQLVSWTEAVQHRHLWHFPSAYMHAKQYIPQLMLGTPPPPSLFVAKLLVREIEHTSTSDIIVGLD